ncbi:MAG: hypothetical protein IT463_07410 [Planctomycetes bacterium]|nr:hypothetical protein [Planctomycetota bacterium]
MLLLLLLVPAGCGYRWSSSLDAGQSRTVKFEAVENRLFPHRPGLEHGLGRRIKEEIAQDRRLEVVEGAAEIVLKVSLVRFTEPNLVEDLDTGEPAEILLRVTALVVARGEVFAGGESRRQITVSTTYAPALGESRASGMERLWRDLAREVVDLAADHEWAPRG